MPFCDETDQRSRWFNCGWGARGETAEEIARRLQAMARELLEFEPDMSPLWLQFNDRPTRRTDPLRVDMMSIDDLARTIDRRCRFDPPPLPAPVGPAGYVVRLGGLSAPDPSRGVYGSISAGRSDDAWQTNGCVLRPELDDPIWRSPERGLAILRAVVRAWEPDAAGGYASLPSDDPVVSRTPIRPWMSWTRSGAPDDSHYVITRVGEPDLIRREMDGEFKVWL
ncbi:hypothetical protein [Phenylobacterium sp.]|uniref:hypothetical protein n=1 Tax=Phenylobacterium sp. TaxID=1871053 RepID=UPI003BACFF65